MRFAGRLCVGVAIGILIACAALYAAIIEDHKKRKLGRDYEGPAAD